MFGLNLVAECHDPLYSVCHAQYVNILCLDSIGLHLLILLHWIDSYDLTQLVLSGDLNKLSLIPHYLFLLIIYTPMFFPSPTLGR